MNDTTMPGEARKYDQFAQQQRKYGEYDLRNDVLEALGYENGLAYSNGTFRRYRDGVWNTVHDLEVRRVVEQALEQAAAAGVVQPSFSLEKNVTELLKSKVYVEGDVWNKNADVLIFRNRALDTRTMQPIDHDPDHRATTALPYDFDREATAPTWERVLQDLLKDDERRFFQEFAGYCLTHSVKHQIALWMVGPPGGGKSTLITGLETMLGELAGTLGLSQLQGSGSRFALANIPGKTLLTCTENPRQHIKVTDVLNAMITGDTITMEQKFKDVVSYRNTAKLVWAMNNLPGLYDPNNGLFRRVKVMELDAIQGRRDPNIIEQVRTEGAGIVNWALDGLARLNERDRFQFPYSVRDATKRFKEDNDLAEQFLDERCKRAPSEQLFYTDEYREYAAKLTQAYKLWAKDHGHESRSSKFLAPEWMRLGLKRGEKDRNGIPWYGVKLDDRVNLA